MDSSLRNELSAQLRAISIQPLEFCPHFPSVANKWEQWWNLDNEYPLLTTSIINPEAAKARPGKLLDLLDDPPQWIAEREKQLVAEIRTMDMLPAIRPDIGPVSVGAFLGAPLHLKPKEETAWQDSIIEDWEALPDLTIHPDNPWLAKVMKLTELTARKGKGRYLVCTPDLSGPMDILASLRGSEDLCIDLFEEREKVIQTAFSLISAWEFVFNRFYESTVMNGTGLTQWVGAWSNVPFTTPTCDFNALIGHKDFMEVCLPSYEEQCSRAGRVCFHLDGPDAARHHEALAKSNLTAIQFTPGAGTPSALAHVPMFKEFLDAGKPVLVATPYHEVDALLKALGTRGVALMVEGCSDSEVLMGLDQKSGW